MRYFWLLIPALAVGSAAYAADATPNADLQAALEAEIAAKSQPRQPAGVPDTTAGAPDDSANKPVQSIADDPLARALEQQAERAAQAAAFADAQSEQMKQQRKQEVFENALDSSFPLSPDQIHQVMQRFEDTQYAAVPPSYGQPKGETVVTNVSLDPGAEPPEIKVAIGYVTTLSILDASGEPWPIVDIGVGGKFEVPQPETGSHIIRIAPQTRFGYGNLSIRLKDLSTPVTFRVSAGNDIVHYRYDARIPRNGPQARMSLIRKPTLVAGDDTIMAVLENAIPAGASVLNVGGTDKRTRAFRINDRLYVRTPLTLLSPSWNSSVSSADGTTVYEVGDTPVLLLSDQGQMVRAKLTEGGA